MLKTRVMLAIGLLVATSCATGQGNRVIVKEPTGSEIELRVWPLVAIAQLGGGVEVHATVIIKNPTEQMYCPAVTFLWNDGTKTIVEGDCPVYGEISPEERNRWGEFRSHKYYGPGQWTVRADLKKSGRTLRHLEKMITIAGSDGSVPEPVF